MASANVLLLPEPGSGHLMSLIEAGKRLLAHGGDGLTVTVLIVRPATPESASEVDSHVRRVAASASGLGIRFHHLPAVDPPTDCAGNLQEFKSRYMQLHAPHVRVAVAELGAAALVIDFFATAVIDVAHELAVPTYVYFTSTAALLALTLRLPALAVDSDASDDGAVEVPGMPPVPAGSVPGFLGDNESPNYAWFVYHGRRFMDADGIIINTRTEGRGLVWPTRAPQKEILAHAAVGCFVTHCGWNSTLESMWHGVPLVPWPLYAEQHLNAFELVSVVGVAVAMEVDRERDNFVEAAELERALRRVMCGGSEEEGAMAREKAMKMKAACRRAVEEGGSSHAALQRLRHAIRSGTTTCNGAAPPKETTS
ncbi:unnamed protein product [Triticum turgidum subsp. durum]|uniref:Glycosyltransferase n=1 Tax=Triticum turgidum subsp. durum TaxID=4567 RepID=A0A9R1PZP3_TRITD|nr:unnamed protein product [Triticum turgidum subsp. durum]